MKKILPVLLAIFVSVLAGNSAQAYTSSEFGFDGGSLSSFLNSANVSSFTGTLQGSYQFAGLGYEAANKNAFKIGDSTIFTNYLSGSSTPSSSSWSSFYDWGLGSFNSKANRGSWVSTSTADARYQVYQLEDAWNGLDKGTLIIGFGDGTGDSDFDDLMIAARKTTETPVPATLLLFGSGILGLAGIRRKQQNS